MRKTVLPLLLMIAMVLLASVALAANFGGAGAINSANGWTPTGQWVNDNAVGQSPASYTSSQGTVSATHPVDSENKKFNYTVRFEVRDWSNVVKVGLKSGGTEYAIEYSGNSFKFNGAVIGSKTGSLTNSFVADIGTIDGKVWYGQVYGNGISGSYVGSATVNGAPTEASVLLTNNSKSPVIYGINFALGGALVTDTPDNTTGNVTITPVPTSTEQPSTGGNSGSPYDLEQIQYYYDNIYPKIGSPDDQVIYNPNGTYTIIPAYQATHTVKGTVTSAADGSPISDASVLLGDELQKTDARGQFGFYNVPGGSLDIAVSADGFASKTQKINLSADTTQNFALNKAGTGGSSNANAENETGNETNTTVTLSPTPTGVPSATQTKSPGFEGIVAAIAIIGAASVLVYMNRKQ